uniref:Uncharacterized protein n=1 Tax=Rhizophora mucronata TaxID=61149 RepID=A0A2P2QBM1_RHIMU
MQQSRSHSVPHPIFKVIQEENNKTCKQLLQTYAASNKFWHLAMGLVNQFNAHDLISCL